MRAPERWRCAWPLRCPWPERHASTLSFCETVREYLPAFAQGTELARPPVASACGTGSAEQAKLDRPTGRGGQMSRACGAPADAGGAEWAAGRQKEAVRRIAAPRRCDAADGRSSPVSAAACGYTFNSRAAGCAVESAAACSTEHVPPAGHQAMPQPVPCARPAEHVRCPLGGPATERGTLLPRLSHA